MDMTTKKKRTENKAANPTYYTSNPNHRNTAANFVPGKDVAPSIGHLERQQSLMR
jgi:hypothetical protein